VGICRLPRQGDLEFPGRSTTRRAADRDLRRTVGGFGDLRQRPRSRTIEPPSRDFSVNLMQLRIPYCIAPRKGRRPPRNSAKSVTGGSGGEQRLEAGEVRSSVVCGFVVLRCARLAWCVAVCPIQPITDHRSPITDHRSPITELPITDHRSSIRLPITDHRLLITDHRLVTDYRLPTSPITRLLAFCLQPAAVEIEIIVVVNIYCLGLRRRIGARK